MIKKIILINLGVSVGLIFLISAIGEVLLRASQDNTSRNVSAVGIPIFQQDEKNTYAHKPQTLAHNGYGDPVPKIYINNLGFRDDNFYDASEEPFFLMIGDSFIFGTGVDQEQTVSQKLEKKIKTQVWNLGHIGYSIDNYFLLLEEYSKFFEPKLAVINLFVGNDITELRRKEWKADNQGFLTHVLDTKIMVNEKHKLESKAQNSTLLVWDWLLHRLHLLKEKLGNKSPSLTWPVFLSENHKEQDPNLEIYWERFSKIFADILKIGEERGVEVVFTIIPMDVQVSKSYWEKYPDLPFDEEAMEAKRPQKRILDLCQKFEVSCFDALPYFQNHESKDEIYFSHNHDPHFSILGHEVFATFLFEKLADFVQ